MTTPQSFQDFLDAATKDGPWCFWFGCREPHRDYEYGSGVAKGGKRIEDSTGFPPTGQTRRPFATTCSTIRWRWNPLQAHPPFTPSQARENRNLCDEFLASQPSIMTNQPASHFPPDSRALHDKTHDKFLPLLASRCQSSTGNVHQLPLILWHLCIPAKSGHGLSALKRNR